MRKDLAFVLLVIFLSIGTIIPFFNPGFFEFHDNTQIARVYEMAKSLSSGMFPVRWVADLGYGYGYPIFNFYAPLAYYVGALFSLIGLNVLNATKLMFVFGILFSGISMYFLSKRFFGNFAGVVSAILYMYFPYHAINIYVRGAVAEFYAYAFLPLFFLGLFSVLEVSNEAPTGLRPVFLLPQLRRERNPSEAEISPHSSSSLRSRFSANGDKKINSTSGLKTLLIIAFSVALISLSHNLSIFMILIISLPAILGVLFFAENKKRVLAFTIMGISLGFSLAAFYIIPAFFEMNYTNVSSQVGGGSDFKDHFVCLGQYLNSMWGFGGSIPGCLDGMSFKLGKTNILFFTISLIAFFVMRRRKNEIQEKIAMLSLILLIISLFLTLSPSELIWKNMPLMPYIQFPWRFINFVALFSSLFIGYGVYVAFKSKKVYAYFVFIVAILATISINYKLFAPQHYVYFVDNGFISESHIKYQISKISDEYLPKNFERPKNSKEVSNTPILLREQGRIELLEKKVQYQKYKYSLSNESEIIINTAYFPAWKVYINGEKSKIREESRGFSTQLPKGEGELEIKYEGTTVQNLSNLLSFVTFSGLISVLIYSKIKKHGKRN